MSEGPAPKRLWFRFNLRTLFVLTAIVGVACFAGPRIARRYRDWKYERDTQHLIKLITETVKPETWEKVNRGDIPPKDYLESRRPDPEVFTPLNSD